MAPRGRKAATNEEGRFGAHLRKPGAALADQLDLPEDEGLVVEKLTAHSAAAKAGIKRHDILLELDGKAVASDLAQFAKLVAAIKPKKPVKAVVLRKGKKETIKGLTLPEAGSGKLLAPGMLPANPGAGMMPVPAGGMPGPGAALPGMAGPARALPPVPPGGVCPPAALPAPGPGMGPMGALPPGMPGRAMGNPGLAPPMAAGPARKGTVTVIARDKDQFSTSRQQGGTVLTVTGTITDGEAKVSAIEVQDKAGSTKYQSLDKVPKKYRGQVKELIALTEKDQEKAEKSGY
jgi:hypothetical protein